MTTKHEPDPGPLKIGASLLVGYLRHAYDSAATGANAISRAARVTRERAAIAAAAKVCTGMTDEQIVRVACGDCSIVGYHHLGMSFVGVDDPDYTPALHDGGPIRLISDGSAS